MAYSSSKPTGAKSQKSSSFSSKGTKKKVSKVSTSGTSTTVGTTQPIQEDDSTRSSGAVRNVTEPNYYAARHFYVTPGSTRDTGSALAPTTVLCPLKVHLGTLGPIGQPDGSIASNSTGQLWTGGQGFAEVTGVVPIKIIRAHDGFTYTGKDVVDRIDKVTYDYKKGGHKVITVHYDTETTGDTVFENYLHSVALQIFFSDGSKVEVTQPIVAGNIGETKPIKEDNTITFYNNDVGNIGGLEWEDINGVFDDEFSIISAGSFFSGNYVYADDSFSFHKHYYWGTDPKGDRIGTVYNQQVLETYTNSTSRSGSLDSQQTGVWDWDERYAIGYASNNFATKTGADGFDYSAALSSVGSQYYTLSKYNITGAVLGSNAPQWGAVNSVGYWNASETAAALSQAPSNRFAPVNAYYNGGKGTTIRHAGMCISVLGDGIDIANVMAGELTGKHRRGTQLALALRAFLKGMYTDSDFGGGPNYLQGTILACDEFNVTSEIFNNGETVDAYCISQENTQNVTGGASVFTASNGNDTFVNLLVGNRNSAFNAIGVDSLSKAQYAVFAATMGMSYSPETDEISTEQDYASACFITNASSEAGKGFLLPFNVRNGNNDTGFNTNFGANLEPLTNSPNYIGNVRIIMKPFLSHVEFPVSASGQYKALVRDPGQQDAIISATSSEAVEFASAQGVPDFIESNLYESPIIQGAVNALPTLLNLGSFANIAYTSPTSVANCDPLSLLHVDPKLDALGYQSPNQTVPYSLSTRQPWGRVNGVPKEQHYIAGGIDYFSDNAKYRITVFPKSTLTNPSTAGSPQGPEVEFLMKQLYNSGIRLPNVLTFEGTDIGISEFGGGIFQLSGFANYQFKSGLTAEGQSQESSNTLGNTLDIYDFTYVPGKNLLDNAGFPINTDTVSPNSEVTGSAPEDLNIVTFIPNGEFTDTRVLLTSEGPDLDRPFIDIDIEDLAGENYNLINDQGLQFNTVSRLSLNKNLGHIGSEPTGQVSESPFSLNFDFIVFGLTDFEIGPPVEEIVGCTDPAANNYDEEANVDNGNCIYCSENAPGDVVDPHEFISEGIGGEVLDAPTVISNSDAYGGLQVVNTDWYVGNLGNAVNFSNPLQGVAADNPSGTSQWTSFQAVFNVEASAIIGAAQNGGSTVSTEEWLNYWTTSVDASSFSLLIFNIDAFDSDSFEWASQSGVTAYNSLPIVEGATAVTVLENHGTAVNPKFGTQEGDVGNVSLGLEAGKHYAAILRIEIKECNQDYFMAFNFWVLYCDCEDNTALNFAGNDWSYPWSDENSYPAGYSNSAFSFCTSGQYSSRTWLRSKRSSETDGLCRYPEPYVDCNEFIDFCITSSTFECELTGNIVDGFTNIGSGSVYVNVFGVYTGSDIIGQEYALVVNGQLFQFVLQLIEVGTNEVIQEVAVTNIDDYAALGAPNPQNVNGVNIAFNNVSQGQYNVVLNQIGELFPGQDPEAGPCLGLSPNGTIGTVNVGEGENCEEVVGGCCDPTAINYVEGCTDEVNGIPFTVYDDTCEYFDCSNVFQSVRINGFSVTNSLAECATQEVDTDGDGILDTTENFLGDTSSGGVTFTVFDPDEPTPFNIAVIALVNGNESDALETLLSFYDANAEQITSNNTANAIPITQGSTVVGGYLPTNVVTVPQGMFSATGMYAGNFLAFALPHTIDPAFTLTICEEQQLEFANDFVRFNVLLDTSFITDCNEPCNEQVNPEDCDDYVGGCTDVSATNFNENANYDDGTCEYGGTETCITNPSLPECEECEDEQGVGLRNCDETFGNGEGCGDPQACNYNPDALIPVPALCEYCCDGDENCVENEDEDDCEDEDGNVDPNCTDPTCPDPTNPQCDEVVTNPCPTEAECPPPPIPDCIALGNCDDGGPGTGDPSVDIEDEVVTIEVSCDPMFNNQDFETWRTEAMTCSANEGSKMLFKLRAGVKDHNKDDLVKLTLINYLFNQGVDLPCLFSCDEYDNKTQNTRYRDVDCANKWRTNGSQRWTPKSTFNQGDTVRILRNVRGKTVASYFIAKKNVPAQQIRPDQRGVDNEYWVRCINVRGQKSTTPNGVTYLRTLYEFMRKFCENCSIATLSSGTAENETKPPSMDTGLRDNDDFEITF